MASGIFPLTKLEEPYYFTKLKDAAAAIREVVDDLYGAVYSGESGGMQFDNATSDGAYLALLKLAEELVRRVIDE